MGLGGGYNLERKRRSEPENGESNELAEETSTWEVTTPCCAAECVNTDDFLEIERDVDENSGGDGGTEMKNLMLFCNLVILRVSEMYEFG